MDNEQPDKRLFEKGIIDALNLPAEVGPIVKPIDEIPVDANIEKDFDTARFNLHQIINKGADALDEAIVLAKSSEHPRAYEVVGQLIKTLVDANKDLLELQKKIGEIKQTTKVSNPTSVTNALFVGSTAELQQLINKRIPRSPVKIVESVE